MRKGEKVTKHRVATFSPSQNSPLIGIKLEQKFLKAASMDLSSADIPMDYNTTGAMFADDTAAILATDDTEVAATAKQLFAGKSFDFL